MNSIIWSPGGDTVAATAGATSTGGTVGGSGDRVVRVVNPLAEAVHVAFGGASVVATAASMVVAPGEAAHIAVNSRVTHFACLQQAGGSGGTIYVTPGNAVA